MTSPKKVALVGLGGSRHAFGNHTMKQGYQEKTWRWDEVWTMNAGFQVYFHDRVFLMDDMRVQAKRYPLIADMLKKHDKPIFTSTVYPEFLSAVRFPIEEVVKKLGTDFLNNTASYAIAYAMATGVEDLFLYGCDFAWPDHYTKEMGGESAAYLLGMTRNFGMRYYLPDTSTFLAANTIKVIEGFTHRPLYGYMRHPLIKDEEAAWKIQENEECRKERIEETRSEANMAPIEKELYGN